MHATFPVYNIIHTIQVRAAIPILGKELTQDAALMEMAYFIDNVMYPSLNGGPDRFWDGVDGLQESMLKTRPTVVTVWPSCPNAWMHPGVTELMGATTSDGGGSPDNTMIGEDWLLQYPKCVGENGTAQEPMNCHDVAEGTFCRYLGDAFFTNQGTTAHEWGHTLELHSRWVQRGSSKGCHLDYVDCQNNSAIQDYVEANFLLYNSERPAFITESWFMTPSAQNYFKTRDSIIPEFKFFMESETMLNLTDGDFRYDVKTARCPEKGVLEACDDSTTRTYKVPLDTPEAVDESRGDESQPWTMGFMHRSCTESCLRQRRGPCSESLLASVVVDEQTQLDAFAAAGVVCEKINNWHWAGGGPGQCQECEGDDAGACSISGPLHGSCDASGLDARLCACEVCGGDGQPDCQEPLDRVNLPCLGPNTICEDTSPCQNGGTCVNVMHQDGYKDRPFQGYGPLPWSYDTFGLIVEHGGGYECTCADGFVGVDCAAAANTICEDTSPCTNGGTCTSIQDGYGGGSYTCDCPDGYGGVNCEGKCVDGFLGGGGVPGRRRASWRPDHAMGVGL